MSNRARRAIVLAAAGTMLGAVVGTPPAQASDNWTTLRGHDAPGTPTKYDKVKVLKQGPRSAKHVLVLIPGTSGGALMFAPFMESLLRRVDGWQVWTIERRENLLEDHSMLKRYRDRRASADALLDYYLGWLTDPSISPHFQPKTTDETTFARQWGLNVAIGDVRRVVKAASRNGRDVVLGGHSLGGRIATAYASWDFGGRAGARQLEGLVLIDGSGRSRELPTAADARESLADLQAGSPFLDLLGLGLPWASGVFNVLGSTIAVVQPNQPSTVQDFPLIPASLRAPVPATNLAQYGYGVDADTSPPELALVHSNIGRLAPSGDPRGWQDGELGSARRAARVFAEYGGADGTAWYHPVRLSLDASSVNNGIRNPAQAVFGVRATKGRSVHLPIYAFDTSLGNGRVGLAARALARQSGVPKRWVTIVNRSETFAHIDPLSAAPRKNAFLKTVVPFLELTERPTLPGNG